MRQISETSPKKLVLSNYLFGSRCSYFSHVHIIFVSVQLIDITYVSIQIYIYNTYAINMYFIIKAIIFSFLKYMTEGILIREIMGDPLLNSYCAIMLDEVHERTLYTDILMGLLKKILKKRDDLKLIVASATVNAKEIKDYFNRNNTDDAEQDTVAIMSVEGRQHPVQVHFLKGKLSQLFFSNTNFKF